MATSGKMGPRLPAAHTQVPAVEGRGHLPHSVPRSAPATVPRTPALPLGASEMPASVCPVPGSRRQMDIVTTRAGGGGGQSARCWRVSSILSSAGSTPEPTEPGAAAGTDHHAPASPLHPASPSVAGHPSPVPRRGSCSSPSCALLLSPHWVLCRLPAIWPPSPTF